MVVEKVHETISIKQSRWLEKNIPFITKKNETKFKMFLRKTSLNYLLMLLFRKLWKKFGTVWN